MKLIEVVTQREIILVSGNLCSGKGHYCENKYPGYHHIVVSDIVKSLINSQERSELTKTKHLDTKIFEALVDQIKQHDKVIVDGIRQVSIVHALENVFGQQIKKIIWLDVPEGVRRQRFEKRASAKDNMGYDQAMQKDRDLGIGDVEHYIRNRHDTEPY